MSHLQYYFARMQSCQTGNKINIITVKNQKMVICILQLVLSTFELPNFMNIGRVQAKFVAVRKLDVFCIYAFTSTTALPCKNNNICKTQSLQTCQRPQCVLRGQQQTPWSPTNTRRNFIIIAVSINIGQVTTDDLDIDSLKVSLCISREKTKIVYQWPINTHFTSMWVCASYSKPLH